MRSRTSRNRHNRRPPMNSPYSNSRRKPKKRHRGVGRFVLVALFICVIVVGGFFGYKLMTMHSYDDADSFKSYAEKAFDSIGQAKGGVESEATFDYGKPASVAVNKPVLGDEYLDEQITSFIDTERANYEGEYGLKDTNEKYAQIFGFSSDSTDKNTSSVVVKCQIQSENKSGKMDLVKEKVKTFNFNTKNKADLVSFITMKPGYQSKLSKILTSKVEKEYGDDLNKDYKKYLDEKNHFQNYALTDKGVKFYFNSGTILPNDKGAVEIALEGDEAKDVVRDKINERNLDPNKPMVAITYDDGPAADLTDRVINAYKKAGGVCTFFELGQNITYVDGAKDIMKRAEKAGCELGSHSWDHPSLVTLTDEKVKEQNDKTDEAFMKAVGHVPMLYRPPYGAGNEKTTKIFNKSGILWTVDTQDWKFRNVNHVVNSIKSEDNLDGKVVLLHDIHPTSVEATEEFVPWLKEHGYQMVTVSELLAYKYKQDPSIPKFYDYGYFNL